MRISRLLIVMMVASSLWAQADQELRDAHADVEVAAPLPATVNGDVLPVPVVPEQQRTRQWATNFAVASVCDDNLRSTPTNTLSDCSFAFEPTLSYRQMGSRSSWNLSYTPSFIAYRRYSSLNEVDHTLGLDVQHRFTRRLTVHVREAFQRTSNFFVGLTTNTGVPTFGLMQRVNGLVITPLARQIRTTTGVDTTYQLSDVTLLGVSATYSDLQYSNINATDAGAAGLFRTRTATATALYSRRISARHWIGANYSFEHLRFGGIDWTGSYSLLYTHTIVLSPRLSISGFVGPQYARGHINRGTLLLPAGAVITQPSGQWSPAGGASIAWATLNNRLEGSFVHRVTDGGGLFGAATLSTVAGKYNRRLNSKLSGHFGASYGKTAAMDSFAAIAALLGNSNGDVNTTSLEVGLDYAATQNFSIRTFYARDWQDNIAGILNSQIRRNRAGIVFSYNLARPMGR